MNVKTQAIPIKRFCSAKVFQNVSPNQAPLTLLYNQASCTYSPCYFRVKCYEMPFQGPEGKHKAGDSCTDESALRRQHTVSLLQHCSFRASAPLRAGPALTLVHTMVLPIPPAPDKLASEYYLPKSALLLQDFLLFAVCM